MPPPAQPPTHGPSPCPHNAAQMARPRPGTVSARAAPPPPSPRPPRQPPPPRRRFVLRCQYDSAPSPWLSIDPLPPPPALAPFAQPFSRPPHAHVAGPPPQLCVSAHPRAPRSTPPTFAQPVETPPGTAPASVAAPPSARKRPAPSVVYTTQNHAAAPPSHAFGAAAPRAAPGRHGPFSAKAMPPHASDQIAVSAPFHATTPGAQSRRACGRSGRCATRMRLCSRPRALMQHGIAFDDASWLCFARRAPGAPFVPPSQHDWLCVLGAARGGRVAPVVPGAPAVPPLQHAPSRTDGSSRGAARTSRGRHAAGGAQQPCVIGVARGGRAAPCVPDAPAAPPSRHALSRADGSSLGAARTYHGRHAAGGARQPFAGLGGRGHTRAPVLRGTGSARPLVLRGGGQAWGTRADGTAAPASIAAYRRPRPRAFSGSRRPSGRRCTGTAPGSP